MNANSNEIFAAAMQLPEADRFDLVSRLLESLPPDHAGLSIDDPDLEAELDRRFADLSDVVPWSELRNER